MLQEVRSGVRASTWEGTIFIHWLQELLISPNSKREPGGEADDDAEKAVEGLLVKVVPDRLPDLELMML